MNNAGIGDRQLIQKYQNGSEEAFTKLFKKYYPLVYKVFLMKGLPESDADDLTEEIFIKLITALKNYLFNQKFEHYLHKVVRNKLIDYYRQNKRTCPFFEEQFIQDDSDVKINLDELYCIIDYCLQTIISETRRTILVLWIRGYRRNQMAELLKLPIGTIHSNLERGKSRLRECIEDRLK